jgi:ABC-type glycerol-3-phosphate transport system substrate-binding protein
MSRKRIRAIMVGVVAVAAVVGVTGAALAQPARKHAGVTLTLWHNYGTEGNAVATKNLVAAFEKANPDITIKVVSQPAANYFSLLTAAAISHTGPDLAVMWTGLFDIKYQKFLLNLKPYFSAAEVAKINGAKWMAPNFDTSKGLLVMPLETQFYIGFYNKALFAKAGITAPPTDWNQLYADCSKLKATGVTPLMYGSDTQGITAAFYPWYDVSYAMSGILSPAQWQGLYTGKTSWTSPAVVAQMTKWAAMKSKGCTNSDVLTATNVLGKFTSGKTAMIVDGSWDTATLQKGLGSKLAPFALPFSNGKQKGVVQYPGDGFSVTSYSKHTKEAVEFLKFLTTPTAAKIISNAGLIPAIKGFKTNNTVSNAMLDLAAKQGLTPYPMIDNVIQPEVVDVGSKQLPAALSGDTSVSSALGDMKATLDSLPANRKGASYK